MPLTNGETSLTHSYDFDSAIRNRMAPIEELGTSQTTFTQEAAQRRVALKQQADDVAFAKAKAASQATVDKNNASVSKLAPSPTSKISTGAAPKATGSFGKFVNSISSQESGNNYNARNKDSGAMGKYQIMPSNIAGTGGWDRDALGYDITATQFMANPQLQEKIANHKLQEYYTRYGPAGAAIAWYAGPSAASKYVKSGRASTGGEGNYPTQSAYMQSILRKMGL